MCGICGRLNFAPRPVPRDLIGGMNARLLHRGPEEDGFHFSADQAFGMGMRRLRIIDLATGSQPLYNETRDVAVILNGEIYNYLELRAELEGKGHRFATQSDTEAIVHAYEVYGADCAAKLNGMFAFALWDEKKKRLVLARDRMGIKPLYVRQDADGLSFASEIKALLADPDCSKEIDFAALDDYFSLLYVPGPRSIFKSIRKLAPGHLLVCDQEKRQARDYAYWEAPVAGIPEDRGWDFYREGLEGLFRDALKLQLRSDVPNGLFLSSGLDSGAIAYYASQVASQKIKAFTVHFEDETYSELAGAKRIAAACGLEHHVMELHPDAQDLVLRTAEFFDEPFADGSAIPTFLLCEFARRQITVALSGEGGDELFAGYPTYIATRAAGIYRRVPAPLRGMIAAAVRRLPVSWDRVSWDYKLKQFVQGAEFPPERSHYKWKEIFSEEDKRALYDGEFLAQRDGHDSFESFADAFARAQGAPELEKLLRVDQETYLQDEFLVKSDRMSMAHALEVRVPILDHRLVEFAARIPPRYKLRGLTTKWALRSLMKGRLPDEIVTGAKKGFSPPLPRWLAGPLRPFLEENLSEAALAKTGFLRPQAVRRLMDEHFAKKRDHHRRLWALLNFVLWHRRWA